MAFTSKKGIEISLKTILGMVISVMLILLFINITSNVNVLEAQEGQGTSATFNSIVNAAGKLSSAGDGSSEFVVANVGNNFAIFGFGSAPSTVFETCGGNDGVPRPGECGPTGICFCVCDEDEICGNNDIIRDCKTVSGFDSVVVKKRNDGKEINSNYGNAHSLDSNWQYMVFYGNCNTDVLGSSFGVQDLELKKQGNNLVIMPGP